ncbi:hypothetical protein BJB63x_008940 [Bartonella sp. JB63]|nr:hypothetical protein BJB15x_009040 [Bartonella sp. JB15]AQX29565.1 hypothetical protein BJB63x_008940 [Bartonella sp. JB63]
MVRFILFSLMCTIALYSYCLLKCCLQSVYRYIFRSKVKSYTSIKATLVKDPCTGEYYVQ